MDQLKHLVFSLLLCIGFFISCTAEQNPASAGQSSEARSETEEKTALMPLEMQDYSNPSYHVKTEIPEAWTHVSNEIGSGLPVINLLPTTAVSEAELPLVMQTAIGLTHIDIFPQGHDSGYPIGKNQRLAIYEGSVPGGNSWDKERSRVYLLGNGEIWAYVLYPDSPPTGWNKEGFVFAQIAIDNFSSECFDDLTGYRKDMQQCQPLEGDEVVYYGRLSPEGNSAVHYALREMDLKG